VCGRTARSWTSLSPPATSRPGRRSTGFRQQRRTGLPNSTAPTMPPIKHRHFDEPGTSGETEKLNGAPVPVRRVVTRWSVNGAPDRNRALAATSLRALPFMVVTPSEKKGWFARSGLDTKAMTLLEVLTA